MFHDKNQSRHDGPLAGLFVIEASETPAAAFAAVLAADQGARVVILEPFEGSGLRRRGPHSLDQAWWSVLARGKASLCMDPDSGKVASLVARLSASGGLLLRDNSPFAERVAGHAGPEVLDICLHPTGADQPDLWPWSTRSEFAAAASGLMALTGFAGGFAVCPEIPLADYCTGALALSAGLAELRAAHLERRSPRSMNFALHEALLRMNEWQLAVSSARDRAELRNGNRFPMNANIGNIFKTSDGRLLTVSAATPSVATRFLDMIGGDGDLSIDPRFATPAARRDNMDLLDGMIAEWISARSADEVLSLAKKYDVVIGPIHDASDIGSHPQISARDNLMGVDGYRMPAPTPRLSEEDMSVPSSAPGIGEHSLAVLEEIGFEVEEVQTLLGSGEIFQQ